MQTSYSEVVAEEEVVEEATDIVSDEALGALLDVSGYAKVNVPSTIIPAENDSNIVAFNDETMSCDSFDNGDLIVDITGDQAVTIALELRNALSTKIYTVTPSVSGTGTGYSIEPITPVAGAFVYTIPATANAQDVVSFTLSSRDKKVLEAFPTTTEIAAYMKKKDPAALTANTYKAESYKIADAAAGTTAGVVTVDVAAADLLKHTGTYATVAGGLTTGAADDTTAGFYVGVMVPAAFGDDDGIKYTYDSSKLSNVKAGDAEITLAGGVTDVTVAADEAIDSDKNKWFPVYVDADKYANADGNVFLQVTYSVVGDASAAKPVVTYQINFSGITLAAKPANKTAVWFAAEDGLKDVIAPFEGTDTLTAWRVGKYFSTVAPYYTANNGAPVMDVDVDDVTTIGNYVYYITADYADNATPEDAIYLADSKYTAAAIPSGESAATYTLHRMSAIPTGAMSVILSNDLVASDGWSLTPVDQAQATEVYTTYADDNHSYYATKGSTINFEIAEPAEGRTYSLAESNDGVAYSAVSPAKTGTNFQIALPTDKAKKYYKVVSSKNLTFEIDKDIYAASNITGIKIGTETKEFEAVDGAGLTPTNTDDIVNYVAVFSGVDADVDFTVLTKDDSIYHVLTSNVGGLAPAVDTNGNVIANSFTKTVGAADATVTITGSAKAYEAKIAGANTAKVTITGGVVTGGTDAAPKYFLTGEDVTFTVAATNENRKVDAASVQWCVEDGTPAATDLVTVTAKESYKIPAAKVKEAMELGKGIEIYAAEEETTKIASVIFRVEGTPQGATAFKYTMYNGTVADGGEVTVASFANIGDAEKGGVGYKYTEKTDIPKGDSIRIYEKDVTLGATGDNNDHLILTGVYQGQTLLPAQTDDAGLVYYATSALTENTQITFAFAGYDYSLLTFTGLHDPAEGEAATTAITRADSPNTQVSTVDTKKYLKRNATYEQGSATPANKYKFDDYTFAITVADPKKAVSSVSYVNANGDTVELLPTAGGVYTIPDSEIDAAFNNGSARAINVTVVTDDKEQDVAVTANEYVGSVTYDEYEVLTTGLTKIGTHTVVLTAGTGEDKTKTGKITAGKGNIIAVSATAATGGILISDRFALDGEAFTAFDLNGAKAFEAALLNKKTTQVAGVLNGQYVFIADGEHALAVTGYKNVAVKKVEAKDGETKTFTTTTLTQGATAAGVPDGNEIRFTVGRDAAYGESDVKLGNPSAVYGESSNIVVRNHEIEYNYDLAGNIVGVKVPQYYYITEADVEKAIKAGGDITITAKAEALGKTAVNVSYKDASLTGLAITQTLTGKDYNKDVNIAGFTVTDGVRSGKIEVLEGSKLTLTGVTYAGTANNNTVFLKVTKDGEEVKATQYNVYEGNVVIAVKDKWDLGFVSESTTISIETAQLAKSAIKFNDAATVDSVTAASLKTGAFAEGAYNGSYVKRNDAQFIADVDEKETETVKNYSFGNVEYTVLGGSKTAANVTYKTEGTKKVVDKITIPYEALQEAAFTSPATGEYKLTVDWAVVESGYQTQDLTIEGLAVADVALKFDDTTLHENTGAPRVINNMHLTYGKAYTLEADSEAGFMLGAAYLLTTAKLNEVKASTAYLNATTDAARAELIHAAATKYEAKDGKVSGISIASMTEPYTVIFEVESEYQVIYVTGVVTGDATNGHLVDPTDENTWNLAYNDTYTVDVVEGAAHKKVKINSVTVDGTAMKSVAQTALTAGSDPDNGVIKLTEAIANYQGKTIAVELEVKAATAETEAVTTTLTFKVSKALTADDIVIKNDGVEIAKDNAQNQPIIVGTTKTFELSGADWSTYVVLPGNANAMGGFDASGEYYSYGTYAKVYADRIEITAANADAVAGQGSFKFFDAVAYAKAPDKAGFVGNNNNVLRQVNVRLTYEQVKNANVPAGVTVNGGYNTIDFDFSGVTGVDEATAGLYYYVTATMNDAEKYNGNYGKVYTRLIPFGTKAYSINLAASDMYEANGISYDVTAKLVQLTTAVTANQINAINAGNTPYNDGLTVDDAAFSAPLELTKANNKAVVTKDVASLDNLSFATSIKLATDKKVLGKIYTGMDPVTVVSGVTYSAGKKASVSAEAQQLQRVDLINANGTVISSTTGEVSDGVVDFGQISEDKGVITLDPTVTVAGKYTIAAYAVQPMGKEVKKELKITVKQGITALTVSPAVATTVYKKAGKKATVSAKVTTYWPTADNFATGKSLAATKKVTWMLASPEYNGGEVPEGDDIFSMSGVSVSKSGKVTIDKNVTIPEEGIEFRIVAIPADYARTAYDENDIGISSVITVSGMAQIPAHIYTAGGQEITAGANVLAADLAGGLTFTDAEDTILNNVSYSISGTGKYKPGNGVRFNKTGKSTITVKTVSGNKLKVKFNIANDANLEYTGVWVAQEDALVNILEGDGASYSATNNLASGQALRIELSGENDSLAMNSVKVSGGKLDKTTKDQIDGFGHHANGTIYVVRPSAHTTTVTVTDKATKAKKVLTITNTAIAAKGSTKTKITKSNLVDTKLGKTKDMKGNIFNYLNYFDAEDYEDAGSYNKVSYTIKGAGDNQAVLISVAKDNATNDLARTLWTLEEAGELESDGNGNYIAVTDATGTFTIDYAYSWVRVEAMQGEDNWVADKGKFDIAKGTYAFNATPIDSDGNAVGTTAKVTVKAAPAPKTKVALKKTKLSGSPVTLELKTANNIVVKEDGKLDSEFGGAGMKADLLGVNTKGKINKFATSFTVDPEKATLTKNASAVIDAKKGIKGWIGVTYQQLNGDVATTYLKVTVK